MINLLRKRETLASLRDRLAVAYRFTRRHWLVLGGGAWALVVGYWRGPPDCR
jgi:hypothetical protein